MLEKENRKRERRDRNGEFEELQKRIDFAVRVRSKEVSWMFVSRNEMNV